MSQYNAVPPTVPGSMNMNAVAPNTTLWLVLSIVATIFCCLPFGIVAIVYSALAMGRVSANDMVIAHKYVKNARIWVIVSVAATLVFWVLYFGSFAAMIAGAAGSGIRP
jgi:hypothetical protein